MPQRSRSVGSIGRRLLRTIYLPALKPSPRRLCKYLRCLMYHDRMVFHMVELTRRLDAWYSLPFPIIFSFRLKSLILDVTSTLVLQKFGLDAIWSHMHSLGESRTSSICDENLLLVRWQPSNRFFDVCATSFGQLPQEENVLLHC